MELLSFLKNKHIFTEDDYKIIEASFKSEIIPKGEVIQKVNRFSKRILFIESGLIRVFYMKDGKDITHFFFDENYFIAPVNSIFHKKSERYEWKAIEATHVKTIRYQDFLTLGEQFPKLVHIVLEFSIQLLDLFSHKLNLLQFEKAHDRYQIFLDMYPNLNNRVSLGDTASFLGITQQTLSVVRAQIK